jgi:Spy/CpxP family protein refolding chaperone
MTLRFRPAVARALLAALLALPLAAAPALADPPAGMGPGMGGMHPGMGMGMGMGPGMDMPPGGGMGMGMGERGGDHGLQPHNAAVHFLRMADALGLDAGQLDKLRKLRDAWIDNNAAAEAHLEAAQNDLKALLFADTIDTKAVETKLAEIGPIEGQLWRAFAQQLLEIKAMLTDDQRARLRERMRRHPM